MNQKLTVHVTQSHIDRGVRCKCRSCPIALALQEQHPRDDEREWATDGNEVFTGYKPVAILPPFARRFVDWFDLGRPVAPFTFELELRPQAGKQANSTDTGSTL